MGDAVYQQLDIGGDPGEFRSGLMVMIDEMGFEDSQEDSDSFMVSGVISCGDGELDELKQFLRDCGLSYDHFSEAKWDYESDIRFWRPGMDGESWTWSLQNMKPTVTVEDLEKMADKGMTLQQVIEKCRVPELPAWVMEDDVMLDVSTGKTCAGT